MIRIPLIILASTVLLIPSHAQNLDRFKNFHGLIHNENHYYEAEGYDIFIQKIEAGLNEKGLKKIRKQYNLNNDELTVDSVINSINRVAQKTEERNKQKIYLAYYLIPESEGITTIIGFTRAIPRNKPLERFFINTHLADQIPSYVFTYPEIHNIDFVGRELKLGPVCRWMSPHNIQCPNYGQMNWAIFEDSLEAIANLDAQSKMTKEKSMVDWQSEEWINLKFEGTPVKALRTKIKIKVPKLIMGGSNTLIGYYVMGKVRGKYVTCVLSHYTDDLSAEKLPPLLAEVLELVEP